MLNLLAYLHTNIPTLSFFNHIWLILCGKQLFGSSQFTGMGPCSLDSRRKAAEQAAYDKLVQDVAKKEQEAKGRSEFLPTLRLQLGQGVHMAVTMGLGYALGSQVAGAIGGQNKALVVRASRMPSVPNRGPRHDCSCANGPL
jgi:hypothetical protein